MPRRWQYCGAGDDPPPNGCVRPALLFCTVTPWPGLAGVTFYFFVLLAPVPGGYRPRRVLYRGQVSARGDTDAFLKHLMEMRQVLRAVRAGGLCSCGERLKVEKASLCAPCACKAFWK